MRAPGFWHQPPGLAATLLTPLGALYAAGTARRLANGPRERLGVPVICVGNINAGGTGKTPTVIALTEILRDRGVRAHVVSRGYGGSITKATRVEEQTHTAEDVGDEPLLLAAFLPTWVAQDRAEGARAAIAAGADAILLDDGFQNPALHHDLSIVVVDAWRGFGNGKVIPAGPLREPVSAGMERADLVLSIGNTAAQMRFDRRWGSHINTPHLRGALAPLPTGLPLKGMPVLAFAGIGYPEKFFATLRDLGADLLATHALADHQPLSDTLMTRLIRDADMRGAQVITTEKDAVRLKPDYRARVMTLPVRLHLNEKGPLEAALDRCLMRNK
jgi:tetraacyldisaccharide 4'-kinase